VKDLELNGSKNSPNLICFSLLHVCNFELLLKLHVQWTQNNSELC
jgi:hypothetical protein